ncbi:MAG: CoA pyrophosphatase [Acidimicrobiia bacterium]|nr:CoA pyrophosphatase [Acidimicrobiia bacterium]
MSRGGEQRIPRPASAKAGAAPGWAHLSPDERRFSLDEVRVACATFPVPRKPVPPATARPAAVLMALFEAPVVPGAFERDTRVILTKRPETMPSHQGEIAFPGGKLDESVDRSLQDAALREAHEEVGLDPASVEIVAELDSMVTVMGRFLLTPFVGLLTEPPVLVPHPDEVTSVFDVSFSELLDDVTFRQELWDVPEGVAVNPGRDRPIHFFELETETVWGATAHILVNFLEHLAKTVR